MKNWIKVIFALNSKLDALTYSIDSQVDGLSKVTQGNTLELFNRIIRLNDKKVRLINLRVLYDKMKESLGEKEMLIISETAKGTPLCEIADMLGMSKSHVYRLYDKTMYRLSRLLISHGYDAEKFASDYGDDMLVTKTYKKFVKAKAG